MALNLTISIFRIQHDQEVDQMHQDVVAGSSGSRSKSRSPSKTPTSD